MAAASVEVKMGEPHSTVQALTSTTFRPALNDPANGLWLLKFYAPWCGHCKKLAPKLDAMAGYLSGRIAIGKVDCTQEKELCQEFSIRGYPTLKIYRDGDFFDYSGKRDADSMIDFAERMVQNPVVLVKSQDQFMEKMLSTSDEKDMGSDTGVAFLAYDAKGEEISQEKSGGEELSSIHKFLASTTTLQVFGQVARKMQDRASFAMLHPSSSKEELEKFGLSLSDTASTILAKIEKDTAPVVYEGDVSSVDFLEWAKQNNMALVTDLQRSNFRTVAYLGKPLFIGVLDAMSNDKNIMASNEEFVSRLRETAKKFAAAGSEGDVYKFATMDGKKWTNFLNQFSISPKELPQFLVLDAPNRRFYQNSTFTDIESFMEGMKDGTIVEQEQVSNSGGGFLEMFHSYFVKYMPFSLLVIVLIFCLILYCALAEDEDELLYQEELLRFQEERRRNLATAKVKTMKED